MTKLDLHCAAFVQVRRVFHKVSDQQKRTSTIRVATCDQPAVGAWLAALPACLLSFLLLSAPCLGGGGRISAQDAR